MKLRCCPEDFVVTEVTTRVPDGGSYALYRLSKRSIGTLEAAQIVQRSWNLEARQLDHGGLKDRHAQTCQHLTIRNGPQADFEHETFLLEYVGQTDRPFAAEDIAGNQFEVALRSLSRPQADDILQRTDAVAEHGFANYFDDQRFGSLGASREFIARYWCLKDYERALWLALAEHNAHDSPDDRQQKQILRDLWGRWEDSKQQLDRSHRRSIVTYLVDHPDKFRKAFALVNPQLRGLYLSAFQSAVWNRMLHACLTNEGAAADDSGLIHVGDTKVQLLDGPSPRLVDFPQLPLPSVRSKNLTAPVKALCAQALQPYDMTLAQMKIHFPRDRWFSRALRSTTVIPAGLTASLGRDERYDNRVKVVLKFQLPRGSYATMLVKALTARQGLAQHIAEIPETDA